MDSRFPLCLDYVDIKDQFDFNHKVILMINIQQFTKVVKIVSFYHFFLFVVQHIVMERFFLSHELALSAI